MGRMDEKPKRRLFWKLIEVILVAFILALCATVAYMINGQSGKNAVWMRTRTELRKRSRQSG
jgi:hypothetical protein